MLVEPLTRSVATAHVRRLAEAEDRVHFHDHAVKRIRQRRLAFVSVLRALRGGEVTRPAYKRDGRWRYRVEHGRLVVIVVLNGEESLTVWTVMVRKRRTP